MVIANSHTQYNGRQIVNIKDSTIGTKVVNTK